ncbi:MAG: NIPSNAP family containing protein, partial [Acidobacteriaceae bacterium]
MRRREFLASGLAASALALGRRTGEAQAAAGGKGRQYYELRKYLLRRDAQVRSTEKYLSDALVP